MSARLLARSVLLPLLPFALAFAAPTAPARAQTVLYAENFNAGLGGWTNRHLALVMDPWAPGISPATSSPDVFHEFFCQHGFFFRDNRLVSPRIDLSGFVRADLRFVQHNSFAVSRTLNRVEVSVDGGVTFVGVYDETTAGDGPSNRLVNLDFFAGRPDVRIAFRYQGTVANEWRIDDVQIVTRQPVYRIASLAGGTTATFSVQGAAPGGVAILALSLVGPGPIPTPFGQVHLTPPIDHFPWQFVDANGGAAVTLAIPAFATGFAVHAHAAVIDLGGSVTLTNFFTQTVL